MLVAVGTASSTRSSRPFGIAARLKACPETNSPILKSLLTLRAGSDEEDSSDESDGGYDDDEEEEDEESDSDADDDSESEDDEEESTSSISNTSSSSSSSLTTTLLDLSKKTATLVGKATLETAKALQRAVAAGLQGDDDETSNEGEEISFTTKTIRTIQRMVSAAFTVPISSEDAEVVKSTMELSSKLKKKSKSEMKSDLSELESSDSEEYESTRESSNTSHTSDFGSILAKQYGVVDERSGDGPQFLGGTLTDALQHARSQARMLVVFIPSGKPNQNKADEAALQTLLSQEISKVANKKPKKKAEIDTGSFVFWGAPSGSSDAKAAMKRLQVKATTSSTKGNKKRPILAIVYPAQTIGKSDGRLKVTPKLLAQHHCTPPPSAATMSEWLSALRKRHLKQYATMQLAVKEQRYFEERKKGYVESVASDKERREREKVEKAERLAKEKEEKERREAILKRREELKESLPEEDKSSTAKAVALRFADGRSDTRKFAPDTSLSTLFNWVDGIHGMERETVVLTTMNGKQTFRWDDELVQEQTLEEAGLGRMVGLRVTEKKPEEKTEEE